eukprot:2928119-Rhodomonas_salina.1
MIELKQDYNGGTLLPATQHRTTMAEHTQRGLQWRRAATCYAARAEFGGAHDQAQRWHVMHEGR